MKRSAKLGLAAIALLVGAQAVQCPHENPPVTSDVAAPQPVAEILRRACYDCHSNETVWPWYSHVAPVSWLVHHDVVDGRKHLNFSTWASYDEKKRAHKLEEVVEQVHDSKMPPAIYLPAHPSAKLNGEERATVEKWATGK